MKVSIHNLPESGVKLIFEEKPEDFPGLVDMMNNEGAEFLEPIYIHIHLEPARGMYRAMGRIEASSRLTCSRCLNLFETQLADNFTIMFTIEMPDLGQTVSEEEIELTAQEMDVVFFKNEEIDFREVIQEQVVMALPMRPLCNVECKGLCPICGADLNHEDCLCHKKTGDSRFAVLKNFKIE